MIWEEMAGNFEGGTFNNSFQSFLPKILEKKLCNALKFKKIYEAWNLKNMTSALIKSDTPITTAPNWIN